MKRVVLFEPQISSLNLGDYIIVESARRELDGLLRNAYVVEQPTQTPLMHVYQKRDRRLKLAAMADYKFVCGSNLFWQNMFSLTPQWNLNLFNCSYQRGAIFVGVGSATTRKKMDPYTTCLYRNVLNPDYIHSVRDEATRKRLEEIGFRAINTGCVTMWSLTKEHCGLIPEKKKENVIFTLTDYLRDRKADIKMINILLKNYSDVYFWPQGYSDYAYLNELGMGRKVKIIAPNLDGMRSALRSGRTDYVGTRLHGGIFAMQNQVRSIVISIDNRARDMKADYNIPCLERKQIERLEEMIGSEWKTSVNISEDRIREWKAQFGNI